MKNANVVVAVVIAIAASGATATAFHAGLQPGQDPNWVLVAAAWAILISGAWVAREISSVYNAHKEDVGYLHQVEQNLEYVEGLLEETLESYNRAAEVARSLPGGVEALARAEGRYFEEGMPE